MAVVGRDKKHVEELVKLPNSYKDSVEPIFDRRSNSAQEVLQPSILEEFMEHMFAPTEAVIGDSGVRAPAAGYLDLVFHPRSIETLFKTPEYTVRTKDHDFVIGSHIEMRLISPAGGNPQNKRLVLPAVALEVKRYLERDMLDECSGTPALVKAATPYCLFVVIAEYLKMDDCRPELSKIDEIYVLRKQRNSDRLAADLKPNPIDADLVWDLYQMVWQHLRKLWWDSSIAEYFIGSVQAIAETGEIVIASASDSQISAYAFGAKNVILVAGTQKICADLADAIERVRGYTVDRHDQWLEERGVSASPIGKLMIMEYETAPERVNLILIQEELGW